MFKKFNTNLKELKENIISSIKKNEIEIEKLLNKKDKTYDSFVKYYQLVDVDLESEFTQLSHLNSVKNSKQTQIIYNEILPLVVNYESKKSQDERIYNIFKSIKEKDFDRLNIEQKKVVDDKLISFKLSGIGLEKNKKDRIQEIEIRLSELGNNFAQNVLNSINSYELIIENKEDVIGILDSDLKVALFEENGKQKYKFTLQMSSYLSYMNYGRNRKYREELYKAYSSKAQQNEIIIDEILALRDEYANILGFKNYASLSIETKMANSTNEVVDFLETLLEKSKKQAKNDLKELIKLAKKDGIDDFQSFDVLYYSEKLRKEKYDINEEEYKVYFEKNSVIKGLFEFLNRLFDVEFKKVELNLWDEKAFAYDIYEYDKIIARIYLDLEERIDKQSGAWMHNWHSHFLDENSNENLATAFIVCNFPKSINTTPSLLKHDDVVTLFHEMGHAIHHLFSKVNENFISGVSGVEWDGIEFPSQFLENFAYESEVLKIFAKHYKTCEEIPDDMIEKLKKAKNFQSALMLTRQIEFSLFDFKLHLKKYQGDEIQKLLDDIREQIGLLIPPRYNKFQNSFSHIFSGGYAAGYYSYKWAEVLSADAFLYLLENGIFDKEIATKYKNTILQNGGKVGMKALFREFLGRDYDVESLITLNDINIL